MACTESSSEAGEYVTLSNRKQVRIRALRGGEDAPIRELWAQLSPRSRYLRFLSVMPTLPDSLVRRLLTADDCRTLAFVAEHEADGTAVVVGLANVGAVDEVSVEVGLVVRDDWQRQHVGTELAQFMMIAAERHGFRRFIGHVLDENVAMRRLLKNIGEVVSTRVSGSVLELAFVRRTSSIADGTRPEHRP
jgi:RimJ/RimL family protein N-acetyltransferase